MDGCELSASFATQVSKTNRMMDADEREVYFFLKGLTQQHYVPANSICRHAGGKQRFRESPDWAKSVLLRMRERGIVETDATDGYRLKPMQESGVKKRWVAPHIAAILKKSGGKFDQVIKHEDELDAYYNSL